MNAMRSVLPEVFQPKDAGLQTRPPLQFRPLWRYGTETFAQCPTPLVLNDETVRVFFAERDPQGKSFVSFVDLDIEKLRLVAYKRQVLGKGALGAFDADGVIPSYAERLVSDIYLWYSGWSALASGAYQNSIGVAVSKDDGKTFRRPAGGPFMDRTAAHPYLCVTPCFFDSGHRMAYVDGMRWEMINDRPEPIYTIRTAKRGRWGWERDTSDAIARLHEQECHSRPWVTKSDHGYEMLFSHRLATDYRDGKHAYRIGRAISLNGLDWERVADPVIPRTFGFDDAMQAYAASFDLGAKRYLLYNGNSFGELGFSLAVQET